MAHFGSLSSSSALLKHQSIVFCVRPLWLQRLLMADSNTVSLQSRMKIWHFVYKKAPVTLITARLADCCVRV